MKLATFNANSVRSRIDTIVSWLTANKPDFLCVQETKVVDELFPQTAFEDIGYHIVFHGEKSYNGVAIASLTKPDMVEFGLDDGGQSDPTRLVRARYGKINIVNAYVPQGREIEHPMYAYKLEWLKRLRNYFERHFKKTDMLIWTGDMNVAPEHKDIHNADQQKNHVCYHVDVRTVFDDVVGWGFIDVFRKHRPDPGLYSFYDYRTINAVKRNMGWRIDHILATKPLADKSVNAFIDINPRLQPKPSDHTFVVAEFKDSAK